MSHPSERSVSTGVVLNIYDLFLWFVFKPNPKLIEKLFHTSVYPFNCNNRHECYGTEWKHRIIDHILYDMRPNQTNLIIE